MRQTAFLCPSSLVIACPCCCDRLTFRSVSPGAAESGLEDVVYGCESCDAELIRTVEPSQPLYVVAWG